MRRGPKLAVLAGTLTLAAAATAVAVEASGIGEMIPAGVRVDEIDVGGLSPAAATRLLEQHAGERASRPVLVEGPLETIVTSGAALGAEARIEEALGAARAGRAGPIRRLFGRGQARDLPLRFDIPRVEVDTFAARLGAVAAVDASIDVDGRGIHVRPGREGRAVDVAALGAALAELPRRLPVATVQTPPREHHPHSLYIDRYPLGREATISWGGPELIFRNDWPAAVLIDLEPSEHSIRIQLFSSHLARRVETETFPPHSHGGGGFTVDYTRRVYRGTSLIRDERFRVRYGIAGQARAGSGR